MGTAPVTSTTLTASPPSSSTSQLGKQQFLQLLVAQLKNQDPLKPMDDTQFITQLAQFSTLETLQQIQSSLETSLGAQLLDHAMSLLGHTVTASGPDGGSVTATVHAVRLQGGDVLLDLGSTTVHLSDVQEVQATTTNGG